MPDVVDHRILRHQSLAEIKCDQAEQHFAKANQHRAVQPQLGAHSCKVLFRIVYPLVRGDGCIQCVSRQDFCTHKDNNRRKQKDQS